jgi:GMP synthase (glutamine-hydrolysing)
MNLHSFLHVPFEGPAALAGWATRRGHRLDATRWYADPTPPAIDTVDGLIVMGGPMGVHDVDTVPWLNREKDYLRAYVDSGRPVLGVCLGAQLLADVLGARVVPNAHREIGWFPITLTPGARRSRWFAGFPPSLEVFHWHGDTFDVPAGAELLATSEACAHQAFVWRERVLGLQFHLEVTADSVEALVRHCPGDLRPGPHVQPVEALRGREAQQTEMHRLLDGLLDAWAGR